MRHWLSKRKKPEASSAPAVLEELISDRATLERLACEQPGVIGLWRLSHQAATRNLLVSLFYLPKLRKDLAVARQSNPKIPSFADWQAGMQRSAASAPSAPVCQSATHVLVVGWTSRVPFRQVVRGEERFVTRTESLAVIFCDLEGVSFVWGPPHHYACRVVQSLLQWLMDYQPQLAARSSWENLVSQLDWQGFLEIFARKFLGAQHILQPCRYATLPGVAVHHV